ncbi:YVTN beta-propeller repeat family protein [Pseudomonas sp. StFLB209]|uniref:hypothetical protein n=1 Tax=Pseudomonas sp. StFLB209 TaxID=1028989 RepID=UPI0004F8BE92|nr:hypothetical protein [Pseudomonas sp. StFLB209]BAP44606.1 YVTN beta-propeller repeat family protein [Pseudomonas sp. StFLB209]
MKPLSWTVLCLVSQLAMARDISDPQRYSCLQGDCRMGQGIVRDNLLGVDLRGRWSNASTVAGEIYTVTLPRVPERQFVQRYGADGLLDSGDSPLSLGVIGQVVPSFSGTYKRIEHPFVRSVVAVIDQGVYDTGTGIQYRGRFQYLPSRGVAAGHWTHGYWVFYGDQVDLEENEREHGLYVSSESAAAMKVTFFKADPGYLAILENKRRRDLEIAGEEFDEQASRKRWLYALSILGEVATTVTRGGLDAAQPGGGSLAGSLPGAGGLKANVGNDIAIELVSSMLSGNTEQLDITRLALQAVGSSVKDKALAGQLNTVIRAVQQAP